MNIPGSRRLVPWATTVSIIVVFGVVVPVGKLPLEEEIELSTASLDLQWQSGICYWAELGQRS